MGSEQLLREILHELRGASLRGAAPVNPGQFTTVPVQRPSPKLQKALDWLEAHPGHLDTPSRDLEVEVGVSHMTIYKAQRLLKQGQEK